MESVHERYMRRCLQLARCGRLHAAPNPMVGSVIVYGSRIIGEGFHAQCGKAHAEVNAIGSVKPADRGLLPESTLYVSLEPCAHFGRTPPCAALIVKTGIRHVVVGCIDPFAKVSGRGVEMLREAGIEVTVGVLEKECRELNRRFFTFHEKRRPYIILKWAQSADGFIDNGGKAFAFSTPFTRMLVHKLRSECDAILVGRTTAERENPRLDVRLWSGESPLRLVLDRNNPFFEGTDTSSPLLPQLMSHLYGRQVQSLLVEGGAATHQSFIDAGLWDEIRIEVSPVLVGNGTRAARIPEDARTKKTEAIDGNRIVWVVR